MYRLRRLGYLFIWGEIQTSKHSMFKKYKTEKIFLRLSILNHFFNMLFLIVLTWIISFENHWRKYENLLKRLIRQIFLKKHFLLQNLNQQSRVKLMPYENHIKKIAQTINRKKIDMWIYIWTRLFSLSGHSNDYLK